MNLCWHMITCEYPPQTGGVSDYTELVARRFAACGDEVHVWCPLQGASISGVTVHGILGRVRAGDLRRLGSALNAFPAPRRLLVQWVPHGYGLRSMNVPFCLWLWMRASLHGDEVELMVHEAYLAFGEGSWRQNVVAAVHRVMTVMLLRAARRVWVSIPTWEDRLRPYRLGSHATFHWLPVPSNIPVSAQPSEIAAMRQAYLCGRRFLVGHFGIYSEMSARLLKEIVPPLLDRVPEAVMLLIGKDSEKHRDALIALAPHHRPRIQATGVLAAAALSRHLASCDLAIQPYPDGVSARRGSAMAVLAHGLPLVTTAGRLTEPLWLDSRAVEAVPAGDAREFVEATCRLLTDEAGRARLSERARDLYDSRFDVRHAIAAMRSEPA